MAKTIIIDGYNLAFASDRIRPALLKDKQKGRELLVELLAGYKKTFGYDITVVFDGADGHTDKCSAKRGIRIVFSRPPQNADQVIKNKVEIQKKSKTITVVTSDRGIVNYVKGRRVETVGSKTFLDRMEQELARRGADKEKPGRIDVKEWMEYFGFKEKE
ncbi:MAG: NYN domain-containing protein [Candidatus Edwardsbacteria bacterium]|nr:NYN domain-containing protein [Candidatus Edwardsbacteria bacterium]MBU1576817.1 NYN domain-containing protein [Candidatus Edwardsbacteria bacterium]MBU2463908.1 NYN domain-containing protein [Candidatus Edwardsbacteria bacterium]MBU2593326.1 NYN domain-containing protein [Candidatus Edwardsbacteria bacterium]